MSRLHIYTVHIDPAAQHPYEQARFVDEGFSWKAFLFSGLWALYHRLWWQAFGLFCANGIVMDLVDAKVITHSGAAVLGLGISAYVGFAGNDWLRESLRKRGYIIADIVSGDSPVRGQQRFFDRYFATHPAEQHIA